MVAPKNNINISRTQRSENNTMSHNTNGNQRRYKNNNTDEDSSARTLDTASTMSSSEESVQMKYHPKKGRGNKGGRRRTRQQNKKKEKGRYKSKATSTKPHDAPMSRRDIYFALDCEMVGVGENGLDSALARVSIVNYDNEIVLDTYVKVDQPVTDYRTFVSGIRPEHIQSESAIPLYEAQAAAASILRGKILIGHGLENDLKVMGMSHRWCDTRDTATYAPFMKHRVQENRCSDEQVTLCPRKLKDLVWEKLGKDIQTIGQAHSSVEDAIAAMDLYKEVRSTWEMEVMRQVNSANRSDQMNNEVTRSPPLQPPSDNQLLFPAPQDAFEDFLPPVPPPTHHYHQSGMILSQEARIYAARQAQEFARSRAELYLQHEMTMMNMNTQHYSSHTQKNKQKGNWELSSY